VAAPELADWGVVDVCVVALFTAGFDGATDGGAVRVLTAAG